MIKFVKNGKYFDTEEVRYLFFTDVHSVVSADLVRADSVGS
jgi:hypothetical protein